MKISNLKQPFGLLVSIKIFQRYKVNFSNTKVKCGYFVWQFLTDGVAASFFRGLLQGLLGKGSLTFSALSDYGYIWRILVFHWSTEPGSSGQESGACRPSVRVSLRFQHLTDVLMRAVLRPAALCGLNCLGYSRVTSRTVMNIISVRIRVTGSTLSQCCLRRCLSIETALIKIPVPTGIQ